jgi:autonomous glycyl radical cofactor GrcA
MQAMPYRSADVRAPAVEPPAEMAYRATLVDDAMVPHVIVHRYLLAAPAAVGLCVWGHSLLGVAFSVIAVVSIHLWSHRRVANAASVRLRVEGGAQLEITRGNKLLERARLEDLLAMKLDSETEKAFAITGYGVRASELPSGRNRSRIVLVFDGVEEPLPLTDVFVSQTECVEWIPKIRRFLGSHGWAPRPE